MKVFLLEFVVFFAIRLSPSQFLGEIFYNVRCMYIIPWQGECSKISQTVRAAIVEKIGG